MTVTRTNQETNIWSYLWRMFYISLTDMQKTTLNIKQCHFMGWRLRLNKKNWERKWTGQQYLSPSEHRCNMISYLPLLLHAFPSVMDCTLTLWAKINPSLIMMLLAILSRWQKKYLIHIYKLWYFDLFF